MKVYTLECCDEGGGICIGVYTSKVRALAALRHVTTKARFSALRREDSDRNPDRHEFYDDDDVRHGTFYRLNSQEVDRHV